MHLARPFERLSQTDFVRNEEIWWYRTRAQRRTDGPKGGTSAEVAVQSVVDQGPVLMVDVPLGVFVPSGQFEKLSVTNRRSAQTC